MYACMIVVSHLQIDHVAKPSVSSEPPESYPDRARQPEGSLGFPFFRAFGQG